MNLLDESAHKVANLLGVVPPQTVDCLSNFSGLRPKYTEITKNRKQGFAFVGQNLCMYKRKRNL